MLSVKPLPAPAGAKGVYMSTEDAGKLKKFLLEQDNTIYQCHVVIDTVNRGRTE